MADPMTVETFLNVAISFIPATGKFVAYVKGKRIEASQLMRLKSMIIESDVAKAVRPVIVTRAYLSSTVNSPGGLRPEPITIVGLKVVKDRGQDPRLAYDVAGASNTDGLYTTHAFKRWNPVAASALDALRNEWVNANRRFIERAQVLYDQFEPISHEEIIGILTGTIKPGDAPDVATDANMSRRDAIDGE